MARNRRGRRGGRPSDRPPAANPTGATQQGEPYPQEPTGPGYRRLHGWLLPGLAGPGEQQYLDDLSGAVVLAGGMVGAGLGFAYLGWLGGALGLVAGIAAGGELVEKQRHPWR